jgi:hypothetical protein
MTLVNIKTAPTTSLVHDGCPAMHGTGCVCATHHDNDYVRLTLKSAYGLRESPAYVNRHQVLYVTPADDGISTKIFIGAAFVQVAESLECVVEKLG